MKRTAAQERSVIELITARDGVGVFPTDTLYGMVGSALSKRAVHRIYRLRKRNPRKPMVILIGGMSDLLRFGVYINGLTRKLLRTLWPGPTSVILPCRSKKFAYLHRGTGTIAFRLPKGKKLLAFLGRTGPLVAPSANPEGRPPATTISEAKEYFGDWVDFYVAAGRLDRPPSRLIEIQNGRLVRLR